jgi:hypothetical protein
MLKAGGERWVFIETAHNMGTSKNPLSYLRPTGYSSIKAGIQFSMLLISHTKLDPCLRRGDSF